MKKYILDFVNVLEGFKSACHNLHWDAKNLSQHKLCDEIMDALSDFQDKVAEVEQSISGRLAVNNLSGKKYHTTTLQQFVKDVISSTKAFYAKLQKEGSDYIGMRSDVEAFLSDLQRFSYLVDFTIKESIKQRLRDKINEGRIDITLGNTTFSMTENEMRDMLSEAIDNVKRKNRLNENELERLVNESVKRVLNEKHRPSGVSRRIHTRDANGKKQSFDYIPNLPKYNKGQNFRQASKFQRINARRVDNPEGEDIDTVLKDGTIERKGLHLPQGHYNVNNVGGTEHWGIDPKTFAKKYEEDPTQSGVYKPKGGPMLASDPVKRNISFEAPWGGRMDMKKGSRIMQDPNNPKDTYGIGGNEFDSTYKFDEGRIRRKKGLR